MQEIIYIKPHHFIDIITSIGDGKKTFKPHPYGHAVHIVAEKILHNKDIMLKMELGADDVCKSCIHNINGLCDDTIDTSFRPNAPRLKREWNLLIDRRWCEFLRIKQGDRLSSSEFCIKLQHINDKIMDIYREVPAERTAERLNKLKKGINIFLEEE